MSAPPEHVSTHKRLIVAGIASDLIDAGDRRRGQQLLNAVRCCDYFPECAHVLEWVGAVAREHELPPPSARAWVEALAREEVKP